MYNLLYVDLKYMLIIPRFIIIKIYLYLYYYKGIFRNRHIYDMGSLEIDAVRIQIPKKEFY